MLLPWCCREIVRYQVLFFATGVIVTKILLPVRGMTVVSASLVVPLEKTCLQDRLTVRRRVWFAVAMSFHLVASSRVSLSVRTALAMLSSYGYDRA